MPENRRAWVLHGVNDALSLLLAAYLEAAIDACDHEFEAGQHVRIVERAICEEGGYNRPLRQYIKRPAAVLTIGVIADTHGLLRPQAVQRLVGVAHIIHAGDIGQPSVIAGLRQIAPTTAIKGNVDTGDGAHDYPDTQVVKFSGHSIYVLHDIHELHLDAVEGVDAIVSGHSHRPRIETIEGILFLNPGSAGPRRFNLPVTLATLEVTDSGLRPFIHDLGGAG